MDLQDRLLIEIEEENSNGESRSKSIDIIMEGSWGQDRER